MEHVTPGVSVSEAGEDRRENRDRRTDGGGTKVADRPKMQQVRRGDDIGTGSLYLNRIPKYSHLMNDVLSYTVALNKQTSVFSFSSSVVSSGHIWPRRTTVL